jgi:hypothetical protein
MPIAPSAAVIVFGVAVGWNRTHSYLPVVSRVSGSPSSNPRATNRLINRARALLGLYQPATQRWFHWCWLASTFRWWRLCI